MRFLYVFSKACYFFKICFRPVLLVLEVCVLFIDLQRKFICMSSMQREQLSFIRSILFTVITLYYCVCKKQHSAMNLNFPLFYFYVFCILIFLAFFNHKLLIHFLFACAADFNETCINAADHTMLDRYFLPLILKSIAN